MNPSQEAAAILVHRRATGSRGGRLPESCRPADLDAALAIQDAVAQLWCERHNDTVGGWKCSLPGDGKIVVGPIFTSAIQRAADIALLPVDDHAKFEPELAFVLKSDLPARDESYSEAEIDAAIGSTHLALELIGSRYADPKDCAFPEMLADGLNNQGLYVGPAVDADIARTATEIAISVEQDGESRDFEGKHPNGLPRGPLYWLVGFLHQRGGGLRVGQAVITGSYAGVIDAALGTDVVIRYDGLGEIAVEFGGN